MQARRYSPAFKSTWVLTGALHQLYQSCLHTFLLPIVPTHRKHRSVSSRVLLYACIGAVHFDALLTTRNHPMPPHDTLENKPKPHCCGDRPFVLRVRGPLYAAELVLVEEEAEQETCGMCLDIGALEGRNDRHETEQNDMSGKNLRARQDMKRTQSRCSGP